MQNPINRTTVQVGTNKFETIVYNMFGWIINIEFMIMLISIISSLLLMSKINYEKFPLISFNVNKQNNNNLIKMILFLIVFILSIYYGYYDIILLLFIDIYWMNVKHAFSFKSFYPERYSVIFTIKLLMH